MKTKENERVRVREQKPQTQTERVAAEASGKWRFSVMLLDSIAGIRRMWFWIRNPQLWIEKLYVWFALFTCAPCVYGYARER